MKHLKHINENIFDKLADAEETQRIKDTHQKIKETELHMRYLRSVGDDSQIMQHIQNHKRKIAKLKDSLLSNKQKHNKEKSKEKAKEKQFQKKLDHYDIQDLIEKRFQNNLSNRQKAINKIVSLKYMNKLFRPTAETNKEINGLKSQYDIKSYELKKSKLKTLKTDILVNTETPEQAIEIYNILFKELQTSSNHRLKNQIRNKIEDLHNFFGYDIFSK